MYYCINEAQVKYCTFTLGKSFADNQRFKYIDKYYTLLGFRKSEITFTIIYSYVHMDGFVNYIDHILNLCMYYETNMYVCGHRSSAFHLPTHFPNFVYLLFLRSSFYSLTFSLIPFWHFFSSILIDTLLTHCHFNISTLSIISLVILLHHILELHIYNISDQIIMLIFLLFKNMKKKCVDHGYVI